MLLASLTSRNFRNLGESHFDFHPRVNLLVGPNGQGKTNLLEAVYFLSTTKSFRTPRVANLVRFGAPSLFVRGSIERKAICKSLSIGIQAAEERRRELLVNEQRSPLQSYLSQFPLFAYSSNRLEIIRGGPEERRRFLDRGIAGLRAGYVGELGRYSKTLRQRNALLSGLAQGRGKESQLDPWDLELIQTALPIVRARREYVERLFQQLAAVSAALGYHVAIGMRYLPAGLDSGADPAGNLDTLRSVRRKEKIAGFTLAGPHRDNLEILADNRPAAEVLSGGELKTTVLFLKLAKIALFRAAFDEDPVFLLDDIDAELDLGIIERIVGYVVGRTQLLTTSAKDTFLETLAIPELRKFAMDGGGIGRVEDVTK